METDFPVYLFTGFLEAGKTKFIQETLEDKRFNNGERTLLLVCEEGVEEYEPQRFYGKNVYIEYIENEEELKAEILDALRKKHRASRAVIEYNGMWNELSLFSAMPKEWLIYQEMMFADASTFILYNKNMRGQAYDKLSNAETVVFNRMNETLDKIQLHKIVRGANSRRQITYEYTDGRFEFDDIEDPLPFDVNAPVIEIKDEDYALWYRDMVEDMAKYDNKKLHFKGIVSTDERMPNDSFALGRHVMACCAEDIQYSAAVAVWKDAPGLKTGDWVEVTAQLKLRKHSLYRTKGPVLYIENLRHTEAPRQIVATLY
jgi:hypothetical protein